MPCTYFYGNIAYKIICMLLPESFCMTKKNNTFYVTTPIYYGTAKPHLGSLYSTVIADALARWYKLQARDVFFLTGTDEHGQKVQQAAQKVGKSPKEFVDSFIDAYKDIWHKYGIQYNHFIRTTDTEHKKAVQEWIDLLIKKGDIYKGFYTGWYCTPCELFVAEKTKEDEKAPICVDCNRETIVIQEETYFFRLSAYQEKLLEFYQNNPGFITPKERIHEVISFVKGGLKDLSISRTTLDWGIPFKNDTKHVTYVWADALNNYITAIGWPFDMQKLHHWWPADVQVLGKDIVRFHAIFWPAFLMAIELQEPKKLLVHGWLKIDKQKMSKSFGNVIDPKDLLQSYGADAVRFYLLKQMAITHDSEFSIEDLERHIATDLANDLGNLLNRLVMLAQKNDVTEIESPAQWDKAALDLRDESMNAIQDVQGYLDDCFFHMALARVWKFINQVNAYFHNQEPWKLAKKDTKQFMQVLAATRNSLEVIATLLWPIMPNKMSELLSSIGVQLNFEHNILRDLVIKSWQEKKHILTKIPTLFEKPEMKEEKETATVVEQVAEQQENYIGIEDLIKVELVVGTIVECESIENSDKLLKMQVDCGEFGKRQILAGIRKFYEPQELIGKQGTFVLNLKPRKMLGHESQGMMLVAKDATGKTQLMRPAELVPNGMRLQ